MRIEHRDKPNEAAAPSESCDCPSFADWAARQLLGSRAKGRPQRVSAESLHKVAVEHDEGPPSCMTTFHKHPLQIVATYCRPVCDELTHDGATSRERCGKRELPNWSVPGSVHRSRVPARCSRIFSGRFRKRMPAPKPTLRFRLLSGPLRRSVRHAHEGYLSLGSCGHLRQFDKGILGSRKHCGPRRRCLRHSLTGPIRTNCRNVSAATFIESRHRRWAETSVYAAVIPTRPRPARDCGGTGVSTSGVLLHGEQ